VKVWRTAITDLSWYGSPQDPGTKTARLMVKLTSKTKRARPNAKNAEANLGVLPVCATWTRTITELRHPNRAGDQTEPKRLRYYPYLWTVTLPR
jgi:hypothetical protein